MFDENAFNSLSWADDLVLFSTSEKGLERCLDKLYGYCYKWGLSVNSTKTQCMTLSKGLMKKGHTFLCNNEPLVNVQTYKY